MSAKMSVEQPLWRATTGYRLLTMVYAIVVFAWEYGNYLRPVTGAAYLAFLAVWTLATLPRVTSARRCPAWFLIADNAVAIGGILLSPYADPQDLVGPTLPSIWVAGPVLVLALHGGWRLAAVGSVLMGVANMTANLIERGVITRGTLHNVLLVCVAAIGIGYVVEVARASERTLARALQIEAATRERERLARDIHDSVLQVLAMVQRRGTALGGEAAELGRMAGEQEVALRALVSSGAAPGRPGAGGGPDPAAPDTAGRPRALPAAAPGDGAGRGGRAGEDGDGSGAGLVGGPCDLRGLLSPFANSRVSFAEPGAPVMMEAGPGRELAAAVGAALDNVRLHAGEAARAWLLLEDEPDAVVVTVRDDGPGIPEGRLADAEAEGRLGVALSIRGRLRDLGGSAEWVSVPGQGTEVELRVPKA